MKRSNARKTASATDVAAVFRSYAPAVRAKLMKLRGIILATAAKMDGVGEITETLRWGQPSYIAKRGSTIRIDAVKNDPGQYAMYFICNTDLIAQFRERYPELDYGGNRSILFDMRGKIPEDALRHCISLALRYHKKKSA
jgi:hypothetical protein